MKIKREYIISIFFLAFIFVFMISVIIRSLYAPYKSDEKEKTTIALIHEAASDSMTDDILGKKQFLEFNGFISKLCGMKINSGDNTVSDMGGGYLTYVYDYIDTSYQAKQMLKFSDFLQKKDTDLFMIIPPFKVDQNDTKMISSINDSTNKTTDTFIKNIESDVNVFDLRDIISMSRDEYLQMFFKTDHHWKPETGLKFASYTSEKLNAEYDFNMDSSIYNIDNFNICVLKNYMLGSQGRSVTKGYASPEDISIITPKTDTDFSVTIPSKNIDMRGSFEDVFIDNEQINKIDYYNLSPYEAYMYGDKPYIHIKNNLSNEKRRILILKDSYADVLIPYLAMQMDEIDVIDLRYYTDNIRLFIEETNPDMVIMVYHPASIPDKNLFRLQ